MTFLQLPYAKQTLTSYPVHQRRQVGLAIQKQLLARNPRWLRQQELAYSQGRNLIAQSDADFSAGKVTAMFKRLCQINQDVSHFSAAFQYYQKKKTKKFKHCIRQPFMIK